MNALMPVTVANHMELWDAADQAVSAWRGEALQCFGRTEAAVSETLIALAKVQGRGASVRLRRLVGQRFQDLAEAIGPDGPFAAEGKSAVGALEAFRKHEPLRAVLCHGVATVALDRRGRWWAKFKLIVLKGRSEERSETALTQADAESLLAALKLDGQKLGSALGNVRAALARMETA